MERSASRRDVLRACGLIGAGVALDALWPAWARSETHGLNESAGPTADLALRIGHTPVAIDGQAGHAITVNGTVPAPLLRW